MNWSYLKLTQAYPEYNVKNLFNSVFKSCYSLATLWLFRDWFHSVNHSTSYIFISLRCYDFFKSNTFFYFCLVHRFRIQKVFKMTLTRSDIAVTCDITVDIITSNCYFQFTSFLNVNIKYQIFIYCVIPPYLMPCLLTLFCSLYFLFICLMGTCLD